jgi:hypothetical protein
MNELSDGDHSPISTQTVDNHEPSTRDNPEWIAAKTRGRWAEFFDPKTRTYNPPSTSFRKKARRQKYAFNRLTMRGGPEFVPLQACMTGDELIAERSRIVGDGTSFRMPRTDEARELVALLPHGRLRTVECLMLALLAYAMLVRRRHGLVATIAELGHCVGLRATATGEAMARLIALGFVHADPTFTQYGACWSQRANLWRLTTEAIEAYALQDVPDGVTLPRGTVDRDRLGRRRLSAGHRPTPGIATPRNPESIPDALRTPVKNPDPSGMAPAVPRKVDGPELAHPPPAPTRSGVNESPAPSLPETRQGSTRRAFGGLGTAVVSSNAVELAAVDEFASLITDPVMRAEALAARSKFGKNGGAK